MSGPTRQAAMTRACEPIELRIRRFPRRYRRRLRKLARGSRPLSDLLYSFPGAAFMLAAGCGAPDARGRAVQLIKTGRPLPEVAAALGLPMWTKRLPPEAFDCDLTALPDEAGFGRRIANLVPRAAETTPMWLQWVAYSAQACDNDMALWLAARPIFTRDMEQGVPLLPLAAFVWFSRWDCEVARRLIERPWHENMRFQTAVQEARAWLERVVIEYCLEDDGATGDWFTVRKVGAYRFLPLRTMQELREEGDRMRNCVATYANQVAMSARLIYSIRQGGKHVATMEIAPVSMNSREARIAQLLGPGNSQPREDVVRAATAWLSRRGRFPLKGLDRMVQLPVRQSRWEAVWGPYRSAKPQFGAQIMEARPQTLMALCADLKRLEAWREP